MLLIHHPSKTHKNIQISERVKQKQIKKVTSKVLIDHANWHGFQFSIFKSAKYNFYNWWEEY
jgi:hypothetical protein